MADTDKAKGIEYFPAATNINVLLIAPHGVMNDDDNSGTLAREIAKKLGCAAIINEHYMRTKDEKGREFNPAAGIVDLNSIKEVKAAGLEADFMGRIKAAKDAILVKNQPNPCYIFLIHGIDDDNIHNLTSGVSTVANKDSQILIGIGEHEDEKKIRYSADKEKVEKLIGYLQQPDKDGKFIKSEITTHEDYAGWSVDNLSQLFNNPKAKDYYDREHVQSIQLEIQKIGFRDNKASIDNSATLLSAAIQGLIDEVNVVPVQEENGVLVPLPGKTELLQIDEEDKPDHRLIENCYHSLISQLNRKYQDAVLDAGRLLVREFYGNDIDSARLGEAGARKKLSLKGLIKKLSESPDAPQKSWIYNTIKLVVEYHDIKEYAKAHDKALVSKYENIMLSHKVLLFPIDDFEKKAEYIDIITHRNLSYQQLREFLGHRKIEEPPTLVKAIDFPTKLFGGDWSNLIEPAAIELLELPDIQKSQKKAARERDGLLALASKYDDLIQKLAAAEKAKKKKTKKEAVHGTKEWSDDSVNLSTSCLHGCLHCFARCYAATEKRYRPEALITPQIWQNSVDIKHSKKNGRVIVFSSHDLLLAQWDQVSMVIDKALSIDSKLLIVSKPHLEVINKICADFSKYKSQMLFRFTVGSMDENILAKWEPGAPKYEERKQSIKYAFDAGFSTSISCEPMLEAENIDALVADLRPYITDTFWIGKIDFRCMKNGSIDMEERKRIQIGQADGNIMTIYDRLKDDPMLRWNDSIRGVIGQNYEGVVGLNHSLPIRHLIKVGGIGDEASAYVFIPLDGDTAR